VPADDEGTEPLQDESPSPAQPDGAAGDPSGRAGRGAGVSAPGRRWRAAFFVLASVGILAAITWALLGDRLLVVRAITVSGTRLVTPAQVRAAADVPAGTPLIRVDTAQVGARVEAAIRQVASVRVSKDWPDGLSITVTERVPVVAVRMAGGGYDLVDHDGVIVTYTGAKPARLPLFQTELPGSGLPGSQDVATASAVLAELPAWLYREVTDVAVTSGDGVSGSVGGTGGVEEASVPAGSVVLYVNRGQTVVWGGPDMVVMKARELAILMRNRARYYDVSDPQTAVTR
jgi:cell division protein FtsQ